MAKNWVIFLVVLLFITMVISFTILRVKTNGKYEIKLGDIMMGLLPVVIILILSGQVSELQFGDLSVKLQEDLKQPIILDSSLKTSTLLDGKRALTIGVGGCDYKVEDDIENKVELPGGIPYKYIIFQQKCIDDPKGNRQGEFWGIISFEDYKEIFLCPTPQTTGKVLLTWIKSKNITKLKSIPSFVTIDDAITLETNKLTALEKMERLNVDFLPVVTQENLFLGVITKERITSNLMLNIATGLK
ncbi:MAG: CBS domain-containing protein [Flavobacterium sp.]